MFTDTIMGTKTIEITVKLPNLDKSGVSEPELADGMIPVYYDESAETWKKASKGNSNKKYQWYDYDNKMWANSVTVSSTNRSKYLSASPGTEIPMDDILTMQVWIPRYKYKVWNYNANGTTSSSPQPIEITFENETESTGEITCEDNIQGSSGDGTSEICKLKATNETCTDDLCNGKTYTHPAFTFGDEEIKGFWIGKFELTGTIDSITVKPNLSSIRSQTVSSFETNIMNMKNSGNQYGLSASADTHMIKNSEWGAVAYLSHSKYGTCIDGTCTEIGINNNYNHITGCGAIAESSSSSTCNAYNTTTGMLASTTQNIYGVYDMSGGSSEYTMSNIVNTDGTTMVPSSSGFTTTTYPDAKYYDKYSYSTSNTSRKRSKLGDGIKEVYNTSNYGWYRDFSFLANSSNPWFYRGGYCSNGAYAGVFYLNFYNGSSRSNYSSHSVITP